MKTIQLTQGKFASVDDEDFDRLTAMGKWQFNCGYATHSTKGNQIRVKTYMHREVIQCPKGIQVDHIDMNGLNNCKSNLRHASPSENGRNRTAQKNNTSGFKSVYWSKRDKRWIAEIRVLGKRVFEKRFSTAADASAARQEAAAKHHGEFAR